MAKADKPLKSGFLPNMTRRFWRGEEGTVTIFSLIVFVIMIAVGGVAIDILRYETQRVQLQYTLDRAVLAAASLDQTQDPAAVVADYFARSEVENYRLRVTPRSSITSSRVEAFAEADINLMFMNMFGVDALTSPASAAAEESVGNLEISIALDVSGSMGSNNRMSQMQAAAESFVTDILAMNNNSPNGDTVSMSIVPYSGRVNIGSRLASVFTLSDEHDASYCTRFATADFSTTEIDPTVEIDILAHADHLFRHWNGDFMQGLCPSDRTPTNPTGGPSQRNAIIPWSSNQGGELIAAIRNLQLDGHTAIDLGMKWAVALLDPSTRPALDTLIDEEDRNSDFEGRPLDYDDDETIKVVVLMTDGENWTRPDLRQEFQADGPPLIYYHMTEWRWSIFYPGRNQYWIPNPNAPWWEPWWNTPNNYWGVWSDQPYRGNESLAVRWEDIFANSTAAKVAVDFFSRPAQRSGNYNFYNYVRYNAFEDYIDAEEANTNTRAICDAARSEGIIVFTIGFQAPWHGQQLMEYCATTPAHYYPITNGGSLDIADAFASIATSINRLRLVR